MKYIYVSKRTKDSLFSKNFQNYHLKGDYLLIKKNRNYWGIFLQDKNRIIGDCVVMYEEEKGITFLLIVIVYIEEEYRGRKLCNELVKNTIIKYEKKRGADLIKVVIAGGMPILKCLINVFRDLNYNVKTYKNKKEDIRNLKMITFQEAIKIEKRNYKYDIWQTLFFEKK